VAAFFSIRCREFANDVRHSSKNYKKAKEALVENARPNKKELSQMFKFLFGSILNILRHELNMTKVVKKKLLLMI
jgi:hypothetical protein